MKIKRTSLVGIILAVVMVAGVSFGALAVSAANAQADALPENELPLADDVGSEPGNDEWIGVFVDDDGNVGLVPDSVVVTAPLDEGKRPHIPHTYTEIELAQLFADIESGKIQPFTLPVNGEDTLVYDGGEYQIFVSYRDDYGLETVDHFFEPHGE